MKVRVIVAAVGVAVSVIIVAIAFLVTMRTSQGCRNFAQSQIQIGERKIGVAVAQTPSQQQQGLSGCTQVPPGHGMYFTFSDKQPVAIWMKDMRIPLDIVWIADGKVIGVNANVPPPASGTPDAQLPKYYPPQLVDRVLELNAGEAQQLGIGVGSSVAEF